MCETVRTLLWAPFGAREDGDVEPKIGFETPFVPRSARIIWPDVVDLDLVEFFKR